MNWDKLRKDFFEECTDDYNGFKKVNLAPHNIFNWFKEKCKPKRRGTKANALYWLWMKCLEDETGQSKDDYHDYFKDKFIGYSIKEFNERSIIKEPSTAKMLSKPFNEYMKKVQAEAAIEFNTVVPLPEDQGFDQFIEHYKDYL